MLAHTHTERMKPSDGISEIELIEAVKRHDKSAAAMLYSKYAGQLSSVCYRYVGNEDDVKDVLQESFVRIFTTIDRFEYRGTGSLRAWMTKIVISRALTFLRDNMRLPITDTDTAEVGMIEEEIPDTAPLTDDELHMIISSLPDGYRTVLNLFAFEGKSHKEIALLLGIRESTSASQYFHAKNLLARRIKDYLNKRG